MWSITVVASVVGGRVVASVVSGGIGDGDGADNGCDVYWFLESKPPDQQHCKSYYLKSQSLEQQTGTSLNPNQWPDLTGYGPPT
ncbi:hypothetical protein F0562_013494 [Nyssa sinensis]|uniref:Secreted protein n=1 Tax=Nyssa sinensis TaxID=561372 RepID=A0A5J4ZNL0_9ASTE|nr:hypothetical protein F0562_013494 [Nyssa sinensis]